MTDESRAVSSPLNTKEAPRRGDRTHSLGLPADRNAVSRIGRAVDGGQPAAAMILASRNPSDYFKRKMLISLEDITQIHRQLLHHARGGCPTRIRQIGDSVFLFENSESGA